MELEPEQEPQPQRELEPQPRAWAIRNQRQSVHKTEEERVKIENYKAIEKGVSLGRNRVSDGIDIPGVPDKILASKTGGYFIVLDESNIPLAEDMLDILKIFDKTTLLSITLENIDEIDSRTISADTVVFYPDLGYAWTNLTDDQIAKVSKQENRFKVLTEKIVTGVGQSTPSSNVVQPKSSTNLNNWGIKRVEADLSSLTGKGVNVAILDTGFDGGHPDYLGRKITRNTFVGKTGNDDNGHGMHCTGIACGYKDSNGIRYGVAYEANIYSCKILDKKGLGHQKDIISGIYWALRKKCKVILLSVEIPNNGTRLADITLFRVLRFARRMECITVAAAGNNSNRNLPVYSPIGHPADSLYALAISAIDKNNNLYDQANQADWGLMQTMAATAPGVDIYSSWSRKVKPVMANRTHSGTSMAAPFVAGIIALLWEKYPNRRLKKILTEFKRLCTPQQGWMPEDVGIGMPVAPK